MYEWLREEIAKINTRKFHEIDGASAEQAKQTMAAPELPLPPSYVEFMRGFGNARLYRQGGIYLVRVFANPTVITAKDGRDLLHFGRTDHSLAYFPRTQLQRNSECEVLEWTHGGGLRKGARDFEEWLKRRCRAARRQFKAKQWASILRGPDPFTDAELRIVAARRLFSWRRVGSTKDNDVLFEIHNGSRMVLPYLTIGLRGKNGPPDGGAWLPVSTIRPGKTVTISFDCYKNIVQPEDVEAFAVSDPCPEDRDRYWEFRALAGSRR